MTKDTYEVEIWHVTPSQTVGAMIKKAHAEGVGRRSLFRKKPKQKHFELPNSSKQFDALMSKIRKDLEYVRQLRCSMCGLGTDIKL